MHFISFVIFVLIYIYLRTKNPFKNCKTHISIQNWKNARCYLLKCLWCYLLKTDFFKSVTNKWTLPSHRCYKDKPSLIKDIASNMKYWVKIIAWINGYLHRVKIIAWINGYLNRVIIIAWIKEMDFIVWNLRSSKTGVYNIHYLMHKKQYTRTTLPQKLQNRGIYINLGYVANGFLQK